MTLLAQNIIVGIIILAALAWIIVKLVRAHKKGSVGCSCCSLSDSCPHCHKDQESSEMYCSVQCPKGTGAVSPKINPHENNKNLE